jgi:hypothetical protein
MIIYIFSNDATNWISKYRLQNNEKNISISAKAGKEIKFRKLDLTIPIISKVDQSDEILNVPEVVLRSVPTLWLSLSAMLLQPCNCKLFYQLLRHNDYNLLFREFFVQNAKQTGFSCRLFL